VCSRLGWRHNATPNQGERGSVAGLHARLFSKVRQKAKGRERVLIQPVPKEIGVLRWNEAVM